MRSRRERGTSDLLGGELEEGNHLGRIWKEFLASGLCPKLCELWDNILSYFFSGF